MIRRIRDSFWTKVVAVYLAMNLVGEIVFPTMAMALTSGPVSIDQASFEPAATSEMVDLATGDFTYNIPLLDVDGYPINIAYHGGVGMDQDASMVGLGWTLNVGAMNRGMRGLPDDFKGDEVTTEMNLRPNYTIGGEIGGSIELIGFEAMGESGGVLEGNFSANLGVGVSFNNYVGVSTTMSIGFSAGLSLFGSSADDQGSIIGVGLNGGLSSNSRGGMTTSLGAGFSVLNGNLGIGIGYSSNTTEGLMAKGATINTPIGNSYNMMPVSTVSYTPNITFTTDIHSMNFDFDLGGEFLGAFSNVRGAYFQSRVCNRNTQETARGYGYMNLQYTPQNGYLMDFNREGTVLANENIVNLPITNQTYDLFSATAQGVGMSFRAHRSEFGVVSDMRRSHTINGVGVSGEVGFGNIFQAGINVDIPYGYSETTKWDEDNSAYGPAHYVNAAPGSTGINNNFYEPAYFKKFGNRSSANEDFYENLGADAAIEQTIAKTGVSHLGSSVFKDKNGVSVYDNSTFDHYKTERDARNTNIQYLSADEATNCGLTSSISNYDLSNYNYSSGSYACSTVTRFGTGSSESKSHHLSEMSVLEGDGSRYVYGIPVVNRTTKEVVFNVSDESSNSAPSLTRDCDQGLVSYSGGTENSLDNRRGDNNLFMRKTIPAYASSYLLTAYLSSNYIDRTGNGPTTDDFGNYTKFNYASTGVTKWRFPFQQNKAAYNEGLKADEYDDLGTYVYGERDQWYLHSIESKNFVAEFHYGNRHDGYGVLDENGGIASTNESRRLVKIELYTRQGKMTAQSPIKTVHFEYDYSLCDNVTNNDGAAATSEEGVSQNQGGKLTLKAIYFTYGDSNRGKLHKYKFDYSSNNPNYQLGTEDRWGTYKPIPGSTACDETGNLTNIEYPYAEQAQSTADNNAGAWMLETIHLPSGSEINIEVESDEYAYVQDYPVTKMYKIRGFSDEATFVEGEKHFLYEKVIAGSHPYNYLHVEVGNMGTTGGAAKTNFFTNYLTTPEIYFRVLVEVSPESNFDNSPFVEQSYEYISGYAEVDPINTSVYDQGSDGSFETVAIKLKDVSIEDAKKDPDNDEYTNPISKASWQFTRKYLPKIINPIVGNIYQHDNGLNCDEEWVVPEYTEDDEVETDPEVEEKGQFLKNIVNTGKAHVQNIQAMGGINKMMRMREYSSKCVPSKSWVRLGMGTTPKLGGGHRVKQITVDDNWANVKANESSSMYGSVYSYNCEDINGNSISSGVASYEPVSSGGDENPMRSPLPYTVDVKMRVDDAEFQENPLGESIFGQANVAYSKVTVSNIGYTNVTQNTTGETIYEHFTAKDFPVIFEQTGYANADRLKDQSSGWTSLFSGESINYLTMSQGFMLHLNDMHGKFRKKTVVGAQVSPDVDPIVVYSMEHKYHTETGTTGELKNLMPVVDESGVISEKIIGRDMDIVLDLNESSSLYGTTTAQAGIDVFAVFAVVIPLPSIWASDMTIENRFRSSVTTKVITSSGILDEVILIDKGRYKSSKNLLFDANTGVPVVTEINHEQPAPGNYEKPIYQYDYPAYWIYKGMGLASENWGAKFGDIVDNSSTHYEIDLANKELYLNPGDELAVYNNSDNSFVGKYWIVEDEATGDYYLVDEQGDDPSYTPSSVNYKVIRSGKRNLLGSTVASVTSLTKFTTSPYAAGFTHTNVLNASAVEYTDKAYGYASSKETTDPANFCGLKVGQIANPYMWGLRGNWNLFTSYVYDSGRDQTTGHSRIDGALSDYVEFWENNSGVWVKNTDSQVAVRWIQAAVATLFDREGFNLESKDALGIYSAIQLGYNRTLKTAEAVNARYYQFGFDGFEDRAYDVSSDCTTPHFRFSGTSVTNTQAHSGRYSAKIIGVEGMDAAVLRSSVKLEIDHTGSNHTKPYLIQQEELIDKHTYLVNATEPSKYVLTFWAKVGEKLPNESGFNQLSVEVDYNGSTLTNLVEHRTNIIDGWKRIEVIFELPAITGTPTGTEYCEVRLLKGQGQNIYFDDVRIQPYNSEMVSYVIDPVSLRLWATLDSRNFATFYQYDEEGSLVRIIQETERGRFTVQENRAGIRIN